MKSYFIKVCPKCEYDNYFKVYHGAEGLFSNKYFSHYCCNECNHNFKIPIYITTINKKKYKYAKVEVKKTMLKLIQLSSKNKQNNKIMIAILKAKKNLGL